MRLDLSVLVPDEAADDVSDMLSAIGDSLAFDLENRQIEADLTLADEWDTINTW